MRSTPVFGSQKADIAVPAQENWHLKVTLTLVGTRREIFVTCALTPHRSRGISHSCRGYEDDNRQCKTESKVQSPMI